MNIYFTLITYLGPISMSQYARSCLDQGMHYFPCPHIDSKTNARCPQQWEYFMVRHVAALSPEELQQCETILGEGIYQLRQNNSNFT